jgi:uncharacterized membrane protein
MATDSLVRDDAGGDPGPGRSFSNWVRLIPRGTYRNLQSVIVYLLTLVFTLATVFTALMKYYSFNDTFEDLGINNETQWLLSHGGVGYYFSSGFANIYPFQWQKPFTFVVLTIYAAAPFPPTLIVLQSLAIGLAAIPVYYLAKRVLGPGWVPVVLAGAYLVYFPLASASLFDFEYENFAPILYLTMALAWEAGHRRTACVVGLVCAAINPLILILVLFYFVYTAFREIEWRQRLGAILRDAYQRSTDDAWRVGTVLVLLALLLAYEALGSLYTAGVGSSVPGMGFGAILTYDINGKLTFLLFLFGALAFLPLYYRWFLWLTAPYLAWVIYSTDSSHWGTFGLMYPMMAVGPAFLCLIFALRDANDAGSDPARDYARESIRGDTAPVAPSPWQESPESAPPSPVPTVVGYDVLRRRRPTWKVSGRTRSVGVLVLVSVVFAAVYLPWSPLNQYVQGGYFSGNHEYAVITDITPADQFLWKVIGLIPADGAVLTQNGIPQVSGREHVQTDTLYNPAIPYDYILADTYATTFSSIDTIIPFIQAALSSNSSGILAEGYGAILTEKGYSGPPALYVPLATNYTATTLTGYGGTQVVGTSFVSDAAAFSMWYGPYSTLYPGNYSAMYVLASNTTSNASAPVITLDVVSDGGSTVYRSETLNESEFARPNAPTAFVLDFHIDQMVTGVQFRGMFPTGAAQVTMFGVTVQQLSYL